MYSESWRLAARLGQLGHDRGTYRSLQEGRLLFVKLAGAKLDGKHSHDFNSTQHSCHGDYSSIAPGFLMVLSESGK